MSQDVKGRQEAVRIFNAETMEAWGEYWKTKERLDDMHFKKLQQARRKRDTVVVPAIKRYLGVSH